MVGITGTGGAGKSTVTDELLSRFMLQFPELRVAVLAVDPTRRRTGGALLGDRIRMNSLRNERIFMRSMATRRRNASTSAMLSDALAFLRSAGFDLVIVETAGIGQSDSEIVDLVDLPVYVMTSEFGAASQLEKIDMLDLAELVVINKFDKRGALDALRDVRKQWKRNHVAFELADDDVPVYPTIASQFNDPGVSWMFVNLCRRIGALPGADAERWDPRLELASHEPLGNVLIPGNRVRYLAEIAEQGREINEEVERKAELAAMAQHCYEALRALGDPELPGELEPYPSIDLRAAESLGSAPEAGALAALRVRYNDALEDLGAEALGLLRGWDDRIAAITAETYSYTVREREITGENYRRSLSQQLIPKIAPPRFDGWGDRLRFLLKENLPGSYPYTGGVFPYRRAGEDPTRMFAGEGTPERTNRRFHYLSQGQPAARLSTAFDSVTLYGEDPAERPDIYGKVGNSGVSIATVDDAKKLYSGLRPVRADDVGVDDDQRPGADHPRLLHERRDRPAGREAPAGDGRLGGRPAASSTRTSPSTAAVLSTPASCRTATAGSGSGCSAPRATWSSSARSTSGSRPRRCGPSAARSRPTSSRRTRRRTRASSRPSSR